jgi:hypothetical protein
MNLMIIPINAINLVYIENIYVRELLPWLIGAINVFHLLLLYTEPLVNQSL